MAANVHIWNDMNEPSVSDGPDGTFTKEHLHRKDGVTYEDRELHNLYGLLNVAGTFQGLLARTNFTRRPFILTRSYFAGSQKFAWTWSGDNQARWLDMKVSVAQVVVSGLNGVPFTGTDVGGFFSNPSDEMLVRWFQVGAWTYPFFREHCDHNSKFREPYLYNATIFGMIRMAIRSRYRLLPMWYTAMRRANVTAEPIVLPLWVAFPNVDALHDLETQVLVAQSLLVVPITTAGQKVIRIVKPPGKWYRMSRTGKELTTDVNSQVTLGTIPVFLRGGKIIPAVARVGTCAKETIRSPFILYIALDENETAEGDLYLDDGETYQHLQGEYLAKRFVFSGGELRAINGNVDGKVPQAFEKTQIERILLYGKGGMTTNDVNLTLVDDFVYTFRFNETATKEDQQ
jgi:alpha 1,3-glucosidase